LIFIPQFRPTENGCISWRKSLTDEKLEQVTEAGKYAPENFLLFSPDGKWLGFRNFVEKSKENANAERVQFIFISTDNSAAPKIFNIASNVARITWAADGQSFYYIENSAENAKIWQQFFTENESPKIILSLQRTYLNDFTISPDGENVVFSRGKNESDVILLKKFE
jgi:protease II